MAVGNVYITGKNADGTAVNLAANFDADGDPTTVSPQDLKAASEAIAESIKLAHARGVTFASDAAITVSELEKRVGQPAKFHDTKFASGFWKPYAAKLFEPAKTSSISSSTGDTGKPLTVSFGQKSVTLRPFSDKESAKKLGPDSGEVLLEGDTGQLFKMKKADFIKGSTMGIQVSDGAKWHVADEKSVLSAGIGSIGQDKFILLSDLVELDLEDLEDQPTSNAEDLAAAELEKQFTKKGKVDEAALYKAVDALPEKIAVCWFAQGVIQEPVVIKKSHIIESLEERGIKRKSAVMASVKKSSDIVGRQGTAD